jgi:hypothetical protein
MTHCYESDMGVLVALDEIHLVSVLATVLVCTLKSLYLLV